MALTQMYACYKQLKAYGKNGLVHKNKDSLNYVVYNILEAQKYVVNTQNIF